MRVAAGDGAAADDIATMADSAQIPYTRPS
jgi:hypothetical protein